MLAAMAGNAKVLQLVESTSFPNNDVVVIIDIRYKTTAKTADKAKVTSSDTTAKLKNVAGTRTFQKLT